MTRTAGSAFVALLMLLLTDGAGWGAPGAAPPLQQPQITGIRVGFKGLYRVGTFAPVELELVGLSELHDPVLRLSVPDGDGVACRTLVALPTPKQGGHPTVVAVPLRFGRVRGWLSAELLSGGEVVAERTFRAGVDQGFAEALPVARELFVAVGGDSLGVDEAIRLMREPESTRPVVAHLDRFDQLPTDWLAYEGVRAVAISTSRPEVFQSPADPEKRIEALDHWIRMGGMLVLALGTNAQSFFDPGSGLRLDRFVGGRLEGSVPFTRSRAAVLEQFASSTSAIPLRTSAGQIPHLREIDGVVEAADGALAMVVQRAVGFGRVRILAGNLDVAPLASWPDRGRLMATFLETPTERLEEIQPGTAVMHFGYDDMAGQLRSALDRFHGVRPVPFALIVGLLVLYIAVVGPVDYFVLQKLGRRMWLTWLTFPAAVGVFCAAALFLQAAFKSDQVLVHQADLIDVDTATGLVRGTTWAHVFSPRTERYDLSFQPRLPFGRSLSEGRQVLTWFGLPGEALGGMESKTADAAILEGHYESAAGALLRRVPIQVGATKSFTFRWSGSADGLIEAHLWEEDAQPVGSITSRLPVGLKDCLLIVGRYAFELGRLEPGDTVVVGSGLPRRDLHAWLTGWRYVRDEKKGEGFRPQATPYDLGSTDVADILRIMMFYDAAGGQSYTHLANRYQPFVDSTGLLKANRAILLAFAEPEDQRRFPSGTEPLCNGSALSAQQVARTTAYRFVIPVSSPSAKSNLNAASRADADGKNALGSSFLSAAPPHRS